MKKLFFLLIILVTYKVCLAQYTPVDQGSSVTFVIGNFGFDVNGSFTGLHGTINFDPQHLNDAHFDVDIDAATVNTNNNLRNEHLRGESYFDVKKYPKIRVESTKVSASNTSGVLMITGKLTIKNITKEVSFPFTATPAGDNYLFKGTFKIKRKDFGVGGTSTISDELEVSLNVTAKKT